MNAESDSAVARQLYVAQTRERMASTIVELRAIEQGRKCDITGVLRQIRQQEEVSRTAGFSGIARLCHSLGDCLSGIAIGEPLRSPTAMRTLVDVCRTIGLHAGVLTGTRTPGKFYEACHREGLAGPKRTLVRAAHPSTKPTT